MEELVTGIFGELLRTPKKREAARAASRVGLDYIWYHARQLGQCVTVTEAEPVSGVPSLSVAVTVMV